jgi:DNA-directed RNA polymerase subunit omega
VTYFVAFRKSTRFPFFRSADGAGILFKYANDSACFEADGGPAWFDKPPGGEMARITVEDCLEKVNNRFLIVQMAIKRVKQYREGYSPLVESKNKEAVTALREIAAGKVLPGEALEDFGIEGK